MRVLLVNDDGYNAQGLTTLANAIHALGHEICVVAPDSSKSGTSQSMTFFKKQVLRVIQNKPYVVYSFAGSPADCVKLALDKIYTKNKPDIVLSGINSETNIGTEMYYSGTLGAAMEAAANRVKAAAFSLDFQLNPDYSAFASYIAENFEYFYNLSTETSPINVNLNRLPNGKIDRVITFASENIAYVDYYVEVSDENGEKAYMLKGEPHEELAPKFSDVYYYFKGYTTITPIKVGRTDLERLKELSEKAGEKHE